MIITASEKASSKKEAALARSIETKEQRKTIAAEKAEVEAALAEALSALDCARLALSQLDMTDLR
jgi:dynein heavy chain